MKITLAMLRAALAALTCPDDTGIVVEIGHTSGEETELSMLPWICESPVGTAVVLTTNYLPHQYEHDGHMVHCKEIVDNLIDDAEAWRTRK